MSVTGDKAKVIEATLKAVRKQFGEASATTLTVMYCPEHAKGYAPSGNLALDWIIGRPGVPIGRVTEISGPYSCLVKDTKILVESGNLVDIDKVQVGDTVLTLNEDLQQSSQKILAVIPQGKRDVYKIVLRSGRSIISTDNHPYYTLQEWQELKDLKVGDFIAIPRSTAVFGDQYLNPAWIKILAYLIADGSLSDGNIHYSKVDFETREDFKHQLANFDSNIYWKEAFNTDSGKLCCIRVNNCNSLKQLLIDVGLLHTKSLTKFIPTCIFTAPKEQVALFIATLWVGDGHIPDINKTSNTELTYTSVSEKLIQQLQHLLHKFGIISRYRKADASNQSGKVFDYFELAISGKDNLLIFKNQIMPYLLGPKKSKAEILLKDIELKEYRSNIDITPADVWQVIKQKLKAHLQRTGEVQKHFFRKHDINLDNPITKNITRSLLMRWVNALQDPYLLGLAKANIFWDKIISIEYKGLEEVYDLSIENTHNFIANDIYVHNSGKSSIVAQMIGESQANNIVVCLADTEHSYDSSWAKLFKVKPEELILLSPRHLEAMFDQIRVIIDVSSSSSGGAPVLIVVDSVSALPTSSELEREDSSASKQRAEHAKVLSEGLRVITNLIWEKNVALVFISQQKDNPGMTYGQGKGKLGGHAIDLHASLLIKTSKQLKKGPDGKTWGMTVTVETLKNKFVPPFRSTSFDYYFGEGIRPAEIALEFMADPAIGLNWVTKAGGWYTFKGQKYRREDLAKVIGYSKEIKEAIYEALRLRNPKPGETDEQYSTEVTKVVAEVNTSSDNAIVDDTDNTVTNVE